MQRVLVYGSETWAMKADDLRIGEDREHDGEMDVWSNVEREDTVSGIESAPGF